MQGRRKLLSRLVASVVALVLFICPLVWTQVERIVSVTSIGTQVEDDSFFPSVNANGTVVAFVSEAFSLVLGDTNRARDVFARDIATGETERVSVATDGSQGNGHSGGFISVSADGRFVAFSSDASNLVPGDKNNRTDVFVHDRQTKQTERVSVSSDGTEANDSSFGPSISADGRFVAFTSKASNLVINDTNFRSDVFVHDRQTRKTERVSIATGGAQGNRDSDDCSISSDGRFVVFTSFADNFVPGDNNFTQDVFIHDRQTGTTQRVSVASDGTEAKGGSGSFPPGISADGRFIAFDSSASNLAKGDTNEARDIFVHDRTTGETRRVSVSSDGKQSGAFQDSEWPGISADGRFVVFQSEAHGLVTGDNNGSTDVFVHDRLTGKTERVSVRPDGTEGNGHSAHPTISADGQFIAFASSSNNLEAGDVNGVSDVFLARNPLAKETPPPGIPKIRLEPRVLDFGQVTAKSGTKDLTFTIANIGTGDLTGSVGEAPAPFTVVAGGGSFTLTPGQSLMVNVRFSPSTADVFTGRVKVTSNDTAEPEIEIVLVGVGKPPPAPKLADLTGRLRRVQEKRVRGGQFVINVTLEVRNIGDIVAKAPFIVVFVLSTDAVLDDGDEVLGVKVVERELSAGDRQKVTLKVKRRQSASGMFVIAIVDDEGVVTESNEDNNVVSRRLR